MKQIVFKHNLEGTMEVKVIDRPGLKADGSTINIADSLLEEAMKQNIFQEKAYARGFDNMYYRCGDSTLLRIKENQVILIDSYLNNEYNNEFDNYTHADELSGVWLALLFKNKSVSIKRSTGHENSRGIPRMSLALVMHQGFKKDAQGRCRMITKSTHNHPVELGAIIWSLNEGKINSVNQSINICDMELNHVGFNWDNRLSQTMLLTKQEHKDYHSQVGEWSHQCYCKINSIEELMTFINFIKKYKIY